MEVRRKEPFTLIDPALVRGLLQIHEKLRGSGVNWAIGGDLGETLRGVKVEANSIEILTDEDGARRIFDAMSEYNPTGIKYLEQRLPRDAVINGEEYPVYARSHYFEFHIGDVNVKIQGDLQYKVGEWDVGDALEFDPEFAYIVGEKMSVMPLFLKYEIVRALGWEDGQKKILEAIHPSEIPDKSLFKQQSQQDQETV